MRDLGRPFTPVVYCYMNMVLHYPGAQDERRKRGAYPLDWDEIDFNAVYAGGVERMRSSPEFERICVETDAKLEAYSAAAPIMRRFAELSTRHREEAALLAAFAETKLLSTRVFSHLLRGDGDVQRLREALVRLRRELRNVMAPFVETASGERMLRAWMDPAIAALA